MKRWIAAILTLVLLMQALPWTAFAAAGAGDMITDGELKRAMQLAGLRFNTNGTAGGITDGTMAEAAASASVTVEAVESGYHEGMEPDDTWDAQMLMDWLDDKLSKDFYNVTNVFTRAAALLERMETDDPASYAKFARGAQNEAYVKDCRWWMLEAEKVEEEARYMRQRIGENTVVIEQNAELLANVSDSLFDHEKARLSKQILEATDALEGLQRDVASLIVGEMLLIEYGQHVIDGVVESDFSAWLKAVLDSEAGPQTAAVSAEAIASTGLSTRMSRLATEARVLEAGDNTADVKVNVITENDFAFVFQGEDNKYVGGVRVTVKDLNGDTVRTLTSDRKFGAVVFNANDFVGDFEKMMQMSLTVEAESLGYRDFYIPWLEMKRGGKRTETLIKLTGPEVKEDDTGSDTGDDQTIDTSSIIIHNILHLEAGSGDTKPYIYSCTFNGYDILRKDTKVIISEANDAHHQFVVVLDHAAGQTPKAPVLHYYRIIPEKLTDEERTDDKPTVKDLSSTRTQYTYSGQWKRYLSPDISKDELPWFVIPDTGEVVRTKLIPVRAKVNTPVITGSEPVNPLNSILGNGLGFNFGIPGGWGNFGLNIPLVDALPKVAYNPTGYLTVTYGSSMIKAPDGEPWKNKEAVQYDKEQKKYEHESAKAKISQKLGAAKQYYKSPLKSKMQRRVSFDFGYFIMLSGRAQMDEEREGQTATLWSASGAAGMQVVLSADFTKPMMAFGIPFYVSLNISASAGFAVDGLYFSFYSTALGKVDNVQFYPVRGVTIEIRLALTVTLGVGIKGLASAWVSITGALNIIIQLMMNEPAHVAVYLQAWATVGFEFFWVKYSWVFWQSPRAIIYQNYDMLTEARNSLFAAYAEEDDSAPEKADVIPQEPDSYPQLAPEAKKVMDNVDTAQAGIKVVELSGQRYAFYLAEAPVKRGTKKYKYVHWKNLDNGQVGNFVNDLAVGLRGRTDMARDRYYHEYGFDVAVNGDRLVIVSTAASDFEADGTPKPEVTTWQDYYSTGNRWITQYSSNIEIIVLYVKDVVKNGKHVLQYEDDYFYYWVPNAGNMLSQKCSHPHIESFINTQDKVFDIYGTLDGDFDDDKSSRYNLFRFSFDKDDAFSRFSFRCYGDATVRPHLTGNKRVELRSNLRNSDYDGAYSTKLDSNHPSLGFVALTRPKEGQYGDSTIDIYDYAMNTSRVNVSEVDGKPVVESSWRYPGQLARGDIRHFEMLQTLGSDQKSYSQDIFYTENVTVNAGKDSERAETRLKGIHIGPRKYISLDNISLDVTFTDYDISLPAADFKAVTLGASQYLYWLTGVGREGEDVPSTWRITGVYYDAATGTMSDEIVIAEFALPEAKWKGKSLRSVPYDITLTESGKGYITAKPNIDDESDRAIAPLTLYSFPITLKPVATLEAASLMETTVCAGDFVASEMSLMNEGNMGIGSFDVELWLMEKGVEKQKIETLHANCLSPANSELILHTGKKDESVAKGEAAFYRLKDFGYTPRQHEWNKSQKTSTYRIDVSGSCLPARNGASKSQYVSTNVLVPGALGSYSGAIKIPSNWDRGVYDLRIKLTKVSTYSNWLASSGKTISESYEAMAAGDSADGAPDPGIELVYELNDAGDKLVLTDESRAAIRAEADIPDTLYATEIDAPEAATATVTYDVHDIDVSHRVYDDYYGEEMLEITISNNYASEENIRLTCALYLDDAATPEYVSLPYDPAQLSSGVTQTITMPLKTLVDPDLHDTARVVITALNVEETALSNNEFTLYLNGRFRIIRHPQDVLTAEGGRAIFTVAAAGGKKPYAYQWQVRADGKWKSLKGATEDTLTLEKVKLSWNGRQARCLVTDATGKTLTSDPATLTVTRAVDTGDHSHLEIYLAVALIALALIIALRRKEKKA